eukprot:736388-Pelagomonas_calceolata.AAC.2
MGEGQEKRKERGACYHTGRTQIRTPASSLCFGVRGTTALLSSYYWWAGLGQDVKQFLEYKRRFSSYVFQCRSTCPTSPSMLQCQWGALQCQQ